MSGTFVRVALVGALMLVPASVVALPTAAADPRNTTQASERAVVVVLRDDAAAAARARAHERAGGVAVTQVFTHAINGFAATTTAEGRAALEADPAVRYVADDVEVTTAAKKVPQTVPNGVNRVEGDLSSTRAGDGRGVVDVDVAVIDIGFQLDHPDVDVRPGVDCVGHGFENTYYHGINVAGVVGAADNGIGVVGMAPGARIWAIEGLGALSNLICGLEWVAANAATIEVVNMSLVFIGTDDGRCGRVNGDPVHEAVCRVTAAGVTAVAAAGNFAADTETYAPAAYSEVIAVSAIADFDGVPGGLGTDCLKKAPVPVRDDTFAYFSNHGAAVDIAAPGMCIHTTDIYGRYLVVDGTSFASPHVAGAAALYRSTHPRATPAQVRRALVSAGRFDYDSAGDPDGTKEPLLDVSGF